MGCGTTYACLDCKKSYYVGYGSYGSWLWADTLEEFDSLADRIAQTTPPMRTGDIRKNQNIRAVLAEHDGHTIKHWIDDYEWGTEGGILYGMGSYGSRGEPIIDEREFEHINLDKT